MELTVKETKKVLKEVQEKYVNSIKREISYLKELEDDEATLKYIKTKKETDEAIDENCAYASYEEWTEQIEKEIKNGKAAIKRINTDKEILKAIKFYIENAQEEEEEVA